MFEDYNWWKSCSAVPSGKALQRSFVQGFVEAMSFAICNPNLWPLESGSLTLWCCGTANKFWQSSQPVLCVCSPATHTHSLLDTSLLSLSAEPIRMFWKHPFRGDWKASCPCTEIADEVVDSSLLCRCRCSAQCIFGKRHFGSHDSLFTSFFFTLHTLIIAKKLN